jgi:Zn-dependent protease
MTVILISLLLLWLVSLCCHEYAHARVAYAGGDHTVAAKGYLTMNPFRYLHPMMSIVFPLLILALGGVPLPGGAVYIEFGRLRSPAWQSAVSAAGPLANLLLFLLASLPFQLGLYQPEQGGQSTLWVVLATFAYLQVLAAFLNLLPIPGLDGFGILAPFLPWHVRRSLMQLANTFFIILLMAFLTPNPFRTWFWTTVARVVTGAGLPAPLIEQGWEALRLLRL